MKAALILDPAHGIDVKGKQSPDGSYLEWMWSRMQINLILKCLKDVPFDVLHPFYNPIKFESITNDRWLYVEPGLSKRSGKYSTLSANYDKVLMLSPHTNAATTESKWNDARGFEMWTSPGWTESDELANLVYPNFKESFIKMRPSSPGDVSKDSKFRVLMGNGYCGLLLECGFHDNHDDLKNLLDEEWNRQLAKNIVISIYQIMHHWGVMEVIPEVTVIR